MQRLATAAILAAMGVTAAAQAAEPVREARTLAGLTQPAELIIDRWGVPHIYARTARDAFFLQGYNAARDRLWQIDLWRKRGLGRLSASLGPAYVEQDRAARLFLYRGDMTAEYAAYAPGAREAVEAFAAGVNAYVAEVADGKRPLPVEFSLTKSQPETWAPEDVLRIRSHALVSNVTQEVARARTLCAGGPEAERLRRKLDPPHQIVTPEGFDPCSVPSDVLKDYTLGTAVVEFGAKAGKLTTAANDLSEFMARVSAEGSNNWVISGARTASGKPIVANDPHRALGAPSLRYISHLEAPGLSIIGAGEPAAPGVSLGHNADAAFGLTIFAIDQEDLYAYETEGDRYRYKGGWEPMRVVRETIEVKGEAPREVELRFTRHGPVLWRGDGKAFAMRTVWNQPGMSGYFAASWLWRAKTWGDFNRARNQWGAPSLNLVWGAKAGETGWAAAGAAPVRPNWDGLLPVPGDGRYEWAGFQGPDVLPAQRGPKEGFFATANEMNLPASYPNERLKIAFEYGDRSRIDRIKEVLTAQPKGTVADSMALQGDTVSTMSRRVIALAKPLHATDPRVEQALTMLRAWNNDMALDSAAATIYDTWATRYVGRTVMTAMAPKAVAAATPIGLDAVVTWLESPEGAPHREKLLLDSLSAAVADLTGRFGPDMTTWTWGKWHKARFEPAVAPLADEALAESMSVGPLAVPGSASTPRAGGYRAADGVMTAGASVRLVMDAGDWDKSMAINTPGQSGDPKSPHYRDLFPLWATGKYVPMVYSRAAVDAAAESVTAFTPAR